MSRNIKKEKKTVSYESKSENPLIQIMILGIPFLVLLVAKVLLEFITKTQEPYKQLAFYINLIIEYLISGYFIYRFKRYSEKKKNNNITGDNLYAWQKESFVERHHLRERLLGGSRLKIKREPKRHEIKYYYLAFILLLAYPIIPSVRENDLMSLNASVVFLVVSILIYDRLERRKFKILKLLLIVLLIAVTIFNNIFNIKIKTVQGGIRINNIGNAIRYIPAYAYLPMFVILVLFISAIIKKRWLTFCICFCLIVNTILACILINPTSSSVFESVYICGYMYILMIFLQTIYNRKALKKITFLQ